MKGKIVAVLSLGLLLAGCASYRAAPLNNLSSQIVMRLDSNKNDIAIVAKAFDRADCKKYLDRDVIEEGYQPIQLYIQNNSEKSYLFSLNRMTLASARSEEVAEKVHTSTVGRAVGYGAGALIFWPLAIPAIIDGVKSSEANKALDTDFSAKTARDEVILPHGHLNRIIFVAISDYQSTFTVALQDMESHQQKSFVVHAN